MEAIRFILPSVTPAATAAIKAANAAHHAHFAGLRRERICRELISKLRQPMRSQAAPVRLAAFPLVGAAS